MRSYDRYAYSAGYFTNGSWTACALSGPKIDDPLCDAHEAGSPCRAGCLAGRSDRVADAQHSSFDHGKINAEMNVTEKAH